MLRKEGGHDMTTAVDFDVGDQCTNGRHEASEQIKWRRCVERLFKEEYY